MKYLILIVLLSGCTTVTKGDGWTCEYYGGFTDEIARQIVSSHQPPPVAPEIPTIK